MKIRSQLLREDDLKDFLLYTKEVWLDTCTEPFYSWDSLAAEGLLSIWTKRVEMAFYNYQYYPDYSLEVNTILFLALHLRTLG